MSRAAASAIAFAFVLLAPAAAQGPPDAMPEGCRLDAPKVFLCQWRATLSPGGEPYSAPIPRMAIATMEITITSDAQTAYRWHVNDTTAKRIVGYPTSSNLGRQNPHYLERRWTAFLQMDATHDHALIVDQTIGGPTDPLPGATLPASLRIVALFYEAAGTQAATSHAGGPSDPQIVDAEHDSSGEAWSDITGAWFDDPILDDGLFEIGVRIPRLKELAPDRVLAHSFGVSFRVLGQSYRASAGIIPEVHYTRLWGFDGWVMAFVRGEALPSDGRPAVGEDEFVLIGVPIVDAENGTIRIPIPARAVGNPPDGALFEDVQAYSTTTMVAPLLDHDLRVSLPIHDAARQQVRPFALGGPEVWARLRGEEPLVPASVPAPWYADPFSADNLPNTLQVMGAIAAAAAAVYGMIVVRRRRTRLHEYLREVDEIVTLSSRSEAISRLDALDRKFDELFARGGLSEAQHAMLENRIARVGYALTRSRGAAP